MQSRIGALKEETVMRRYFAAAVLSLVTVTPVFAADAADATDSTPVSSTLDLSAAAAGAPAQAAPTFATSITSGRRPGALMPMYVLSFALQGYDAYSTLTALKAGAREANPVMQSVVGNPVAFAAVKVGTAAAAFMATEHLWKTHHRTAAVAVIAASNIGMSLVAVNNARVISSLK
jgi:hypothetical protein